MGISFGTDIPFVRHLGFEMLRFEGGESEIAWTPGPEHMNSFAVTHGGACMTLLDVAMATAARSVQPGMGVVTIEMKTTFMRPSSGALRGLGKLMHRTATMGFCDGRIVDAKGQVCAHATGTFKYVRRLPTGPGSAHDLSPIPTD